MIAGLSLKLWLTKFSALPTAAVLVALVIPTTQAEVLHYAPDTHCEARYRRSLQRWANCLPTPFRRLSRLLRPFTTLLWPLATL